jgi:hypothetical protein
MVEGGAFNTPSNYPRIDLVESKAHGTYRLASSLFQGVFVSCGLRVRQ